MEELGGGAEKRRMKMKAMVAIDESDGSFYALKWALDNLFNVMTTTEATTSQNEGMLFLVHVEPIFHNYVHPIGPAGAGLYTFTNFNFSLYFLSISLLEIKGQAL